jgi:MFS family permease
MRFPWWNGLLTLRARSSHANNRGPEVNDLRKRELLLSLKYCTIEACFSVPMLNLTLGNMPFLIAFAVTGLGWSDAAIGLLAATPFICLFLQTPITFWLQRHFSLYQIICATFILNALPWPLVLLFPWLGESKHLLFAGIVALSNLGNAVCGVTWSAAVSELVPLNIRGRYFGTRNMMFGFWALVATLTAGYVAEKYDSKLWIFGLIFTLAAISRLLGLFFLTRMKFPERVMRVQPQRAPLNTFTEVFRDQNFLRFMLFTGLFGLFFNAGQPFYSVFVLKELPFTLSDLVVLTTVQTVGTLIALRTWGMLVDRFGNKPVMLTTALVWLTVAGVSWMLSSPARHAHLYVTYFITGFMLAGFQQVGQFNLMIKIGLLQLHEPARGTRADARRLRAAHLAGRADRTLGPAAHALSPDDRRVDCDVPGHPGTPGWRARTGGKIDSRPRERDVAHARVQPDARRHEHGAIHVHAARPVADRSGIAPNFSPPRRRARRRRRRIDGGRLAHIEVRH